MRQSLSSEAEQRHHDRSQQNRQYAYDITQKLTYYVISSELIFCGYILLNADKLGVIKYSSILFLLSGIAAFCGVFWRFFYNQTYHDQAHGSNESKVIAALQSFFYSMYVLLSIVFFSALLFFGYSYIASVENGSHEVTPRVSVEKGNTK